MLALPGCIGTGSGSDYRWVGPIREGPRSSMEDPHPFLSGVPELLRLANCRAHAQLQEGPATRPDYPTFELYGGGEEEL